MRWPQEVTALWSISLILSLYCFQKAHGSLRSKSTFGPLAEATWNRLLTVGGQANAFGIFSFVLGVGGWEEGGKAKTRGRILKIHTGVHMSDWVS